MLDGLNLLVIGGSGDLGRALVAELLAKGATVDATCRTRPEPLASLRSALPDAPRLDSGINGDATPGGRLRLHTVDVRDPASVDGLARTLADAGRVPDVLVYNAGILKDGPALGLDDRDLAEVLDVNLAGAHRVCRAVGPHMRRRRKGKIFLVSSVAGERGGRGQANYAASKAGLEAFGRSLALEMADRGILVNMIAPGAIESRMTGDVAAVAGPQLLERIALKRLGTPAEVARFIAHLSSPEIGYITGQTFRIDGGFKL